MRLRLLLILFLFLFLFLSLAILISAILFLHDCISSLSFTTHFKIGVTLFGCQLRLKVRVALGSRFDHFLFMSSTSTSYLLRILATSLHFLSLTLAPLTTNISLGTIFIKVEVKSGQQLCALLDHRFVFLRLCILEL